MGKGPGFYQTRQGDLCYLLNDGISLVMTDGTTIEADDIPGLKKVDPISYLNSKFKEYSQALRLVLEIGGLLVSRSGLKESELPWKVQSPRLRAQPISHLPSSESADPCDRG